MKVIPINCFGLIDSKTNFLSLNEARLVPPTVLNIFGFLVSVREPALTACNHVFPNVMAPNEIGKYFGQIVLNEKLNVKLKSCSYKLFNKWPQMGQKIC